MITKFPKCNIKPMKLSGKIQFTYDIESYAGYADVHECFEEAMEILIRFGTAIVEFDKND